MTQQFIYDQSATWTDGGTTYDGIKLNVTDTASAAASKLLDLQVGGTSKFKVQKDGQILAADGSKTAPSHSFASATGIGFYYRAGVLLALASGGNERIQWDLNGNFFLNTTIGFGSTDYSVSSANAFLHRPAAATLQMGEGDAASPVAQKFKVQGVVAGTTNTAGADWTIAGSVGTGTGAGGSLVFQTAPAGGSGSAQNALVTALTIASSGAATFVSNVSTASTGAFVFGSRGRIDTSADGVLTLRNNAQTDFGRLTFGGTTSSFPAIKRSGVLIAARLADDSADAGLTALYVKSAATTVAALTAAATAGAGARAFVTDATATTFMSTVAGGGANAVPVTSDGTNWVIG